MSVAIQCHQSCDLLMSNECRVTMPLVLFFRFDSIFAWHSNMAGIVIKTMQCHNCLGLIKSKADSINVVDAAEKIA